MVTNKRPLHKVYADFLHITWTCESKYNSEYLPWFTNSEVVVAPPAPLLGSIVWLLVLIDEILPCDITALFSISSVLVVQKSSDMLGFLTVWAWLDSPFGGVSTKVIGLGLLWHDRQPLLCYKTHLILL